MRKLILVGLILLVACKGYESHDNSNSNNDNSINYIDNAQREACQSCAKTSTLAEYGFTEISCKDFCGGEIGGSCFTDCKARQDSAREQALMDCYVSFECPQIK